MEPCFSMPPKPIGCGFQFNYRSTLECYPNNREEDSEGSCLLVIALTEKRLYLHRPECC